MDSGEDYFYRVWYPEAGIKKVIKIHRSAIGNLKSKLHAALRLPSDVSVNYKLYVSDDDDWYECNELDLPPRGKLKVETSPIDRIKIETYPFEKLKKELSGLQSENASVTIQHTNTNSVEKSSRQPIREKQHKRKSTIKRTPKKNGKCLPTTPILSESGTSEQGDFKIKTCSAVCSHQSEPVKEQPVSGLLNRKRSFSSAHSLLTNSRRSSGCEIVENVDITEASTGRKSTICSSHSIEHFPTNETQERRKGSGQCSWTHSSQLLEHAKIQNVQNTSMHSGQCFNFAIQNPKVQLNDGMLDSTSYHLPSSKAIVNDEPNKTELSSPALTDLNQPLELLKKEVDISELKKVKGQDGYSGTTTDEETCDGESDTPSVKTEPLHSFPNNTEEKSTERVSLKGKIVKQQMKSKKKPKNRRSVENCSEEVLVCARVDDKDKCDDDTRSVDDEVICDGTSNVDDEVKCDDDASSADDEDNCNSDTSNVHTRESKDLCIPEAQVTSITYVPKIKPCYVRLKAIDLTTSLQRQLDTLKNKQTSSNSQVSSSSPVSKNSHNNLVQLELDKNSSSFSRNPDTSRSMRMLSSHTRKSLCQSDISDTVKQGETCKTVQKTESRKVPLKVKMITRRYRLDRCKSSSYGSTVKAYYHVRNFNTSPCSFKIPSALKKNNSRASGSIASGSVILKNVSAHALKFSDSLGEVAEQDTTFNRNCVFSPDIPSPRKASETSRKRKAEVTPIKEDEKGDHYGLRTKRGRTNENSHFEPSCTERGDELTSYNKVTRDNRFIIQDDVKKSENEVVCDDDDVDVDDDDDVDDDHHVDDDDNVDDDNDDNVLDNDDSDKTYEPSETDDEITSDVENRLSKSVKRKFSCPSKNKNIIAGQDDDKKSVINDKASDGSDRQFSQSGDMEPSYPEQVIAEEMENRYPFEVVNTFKQISPQSEAEKLGEAVPVISSLTKSKDTYHCFLESSTIEAIKERKFSPEKENILHSLLLKPNAEELMNVIPQKSSVECSNETNKEKDGKPTNSSNVLNEEEASSYCNIINIPRHLIPKPKTNETIVAVPLNLLINKNKDTKCSVNEASSTMEMQEVERSSQLPQIISVGKAVKTEKASNQGSVSCCEIDNEMAKSIQCSLLEVDSENAQLNGNVNHLEGIQSNKGKGKSPNDSDFNSDKENSDMDSDGISVIEGSMDATMIPLGNNGTDKGESEKVSKEECSTVVLSDNFFNVGDCVSDEKVFTKLTIKNDRVFLLRNENDPIGQERENMEETKLCHEEMGKYDHSCNHHDDTDAINTTVVEAGSLIPTVVDDIMKKTNVQSVEEGRQKKACNIKAILVKHKNKQYSLQPNPGHDHTEEFSVRHKIKDMLRRKLIGETSTLTMVPVLPPSVERNDSKRIDNRTSREEKGSEMNSNNKIISNTDTNNVRYSLRPRKEPLNLVESSESEEDYEEDKLTLKPNVKDLLRRKVIDELDCSETMFSSDSDASDEDLSRKKSVMSEKENNETAIDRCYNGPVGTESVITLQPELPDSMESTAHRKAQGGTSGSEEKGHEITSDNKSISERHGNLRFLLQKTIETINLKERDKSEEVKEQHLTTNSLISSVIDEAFVSETHELPSESYNLDKCLSSKDRRQSSKKGERSISDGLYDETSFSGPEKQKVKRRKSHSDVVSKLGNDGDNAVYIKLEYLVSDKSSDSAEVEDSTKFEENGPEITDDDRTISSRQNNARYSLRKSKPLNLMESDVSDDEDSNSTKHKYMYSEKNKMRKQRQEDSAYRPDADPSSESDLSDEDSAREQIFVETISSKKPNNVSSWEPYANAMVFPLVVNAQVDGRDITAEELATTRYDGNHGEQRTEQITYDKECADLENKWEFMYGEKGTFQRLQDKNTVFKLCIYEDSEAFKKCFEFLEWNCRMRCIFCSKEFELFSAYVLHCFEGNRCTKLIKSKRKCACLPCGKFGMVKDGFLRHMLKIRTHGEKKAAFIPKTKEEGNGSDEQDISATFQPGYKCTVCNDSVVWSSLREAVIHIKYKHTNEKFGNFIYRKKRFEKGKVIISGQETQTKRRNCLCSFCGQVFKNKDSLLSHYASFHADIASDQLGMSQDQLLCPHCGKRYSMHHRYNYNRHLRYHTSPVKCELCGKTLKNQNSYLAHKLRHKLRDYPCVCGKVFKNKFNYSQHVRTHRLNEEERRHKCDECDKTFIYRHHLLNHKASTHSSERNFACSACGASFKLKHHLKQHVEKACANSNSET